MIPHYLSHYLSKVLQNISNFSHETIKSLFNSNWFALLDLNLPFSPPHLDLLLVQFDEHKTLAGKRQTEDGLELGVLFLGLVL